MWIYRYFAVFLWTFLQILPTTKGDAIAIPIRAVSQRYSNADIASSSPEGYQYSGLNPSTPVVINRQIVQKVNPNLTQSPIVYKTIDPSVPSSKIVRVISKPVILCSANNAPSTGKDCSEYTAPKVISIPETTLCSSKNTFPSRLIIKNISPSSCNSENELQNFDTSSNICSNPTVVFRKPVPAMTCHNNLPSETFKPQIILRNIPAQPLQPKSRLQVSDINNIKANPKNSFLTPYSNPQCNSNPNPLITEKRNVLGEYRPLPAEFPCPANSVNNMQQVCDVHIAYPNQNYRCQGSLKCDTVNSYPEKYCPNYLNDKRLTNIRPIKNNICTYRPAQIVEDKQINTLGHVPQREYLDNNNALKFSQYNTGVIPPSSCSSVFNYHSEVVQSPKLSVFSPGIEHFGASPRHDNSFPLEMAQKIIPSVACIENQIQRDNVVERNYCNEISPQFNGFNRASINHVNTFSPPIMSLGNTLTQGSSHVGPISKSSVLKSGIIPSMLTSSSPETRCNTPLKSNTPPSVPVESSLKLSPSVLSMSSILTKPSIKCARFPSVLPATLPAINLPGALTMPVVLIDSKSECDPVEELLKVMVCKEILDKKNDLDVLNPLIELISED